MSSSSSSPSPSSSASPPSPASTASPPSPSSPAASGAPPPPLPSPPPPDAASPPSGTAPSPPVPSRSPPPATSPPPPSTGGAPDATSPPSGTAPSPPVPSRSPPPAASPPPPSTVAPPPPSPSVPPKPTTPNAPPPSPPSPPPPASRPPQSRPPPTGTPPPRSSPSQPPHPPASSCPSRLPPPTNSSETPNPPSLSPPSTVIPPGTTDCNRTNPDGPRNSRSSLATGFVIAIVVAAFIVLGLVGLAVCLIRKRRKAVAERNAEVVMPPPPASSMSDSAILRSQTAPLVQRRNSGTTSRINSLSGTPRAGTTPSFSYEELYRITNGFSPDNILGEGGFGSVYKGCLPNGREVAVKRLKIESRQGDREFKAEVEIISRVHHRHLVSLVGYCISDDQRLLVYDFVPNGTLESHLHAGSKRPAMDWETRVKVAAGAARGIAYLHEDCNPKIIHRDIKSSNILLDNNFEAQVSDFGLARLALELDAHTHVTTRVMGTFGYLAPEYVSTGKLTEKSDVFSFGVVLLELITGQKPLDSTKAFGDESLAMWARPLLSNALTTGELGELPDRRLQKNFDKREMLRMIGAAAACIRHTASKRPQMGKVVRFLDSFADIDLTCGVTPGQSEVFDVANSAEHRIFQQLALGNPGSSSDYPHFDGGHQKEA